MSTGTRKSGRGVVVIGAAMAFVAGAGLALAEPVSLPSGAVIDQVTLYARDNNGGGHPR